MNKYIISILVTASAMTISAVSATSINTSTTTITSTDATNTGTTTGTGVKCMTTSGVTQADNQAAILAAQQAFSVEVARLVSVKQAAYSGAQTLTGTTRVDALKTANVAFRTGMQKAQKALSLVKQGRRSNHEEIRECRKDKKEARKEHREEVQSLKNKKDESRGRSGDHR